jgi:hypothetical protein
VIDRNTSIYPFALDKCHTRISIVGTNLVYLNNAPIRSTILPSIFKGQKTLGRHLDDVVHPQVSPFYKDLVISTLSEKAIIKLHIILNSDHILLTSMPIFDKNNKIIAITLLETPYTSVQDDLV